MEGKDNIFLLLILGRSHSTQNLSEVSDDRDRQEFVMFDLAY